MLALTQTRIDLYRAQPPADTGIPNVAPRRPVDDSIPQEAEIAAAVRRLRRNKAPGISKMTSNHLKAWMKQALDNFFELPRSPTATLFPKLNLCTASTRNLRSFRQSSVHNGATICSCYCRMPLLVTLSIYLRYSILPSSSSCPKREGYN